MTTEPTNEFSRCYLILQRPDGTKEVFEVAGYRVEMSPVEVPYFRTEEPQLSKPSVREYVLTVPATKQIPHVLLPGWFLTKGR